jgi:hypothetical protein
MTRRSFAAGVVAATGICAVSAQQRGYEENAPMVSESGKFCFRRFVQTSVLEERKETDCL